MKALVALAALLAAGISSARPLVIQEVARIPKPDPTFTTFGWHVGLDGDFAVVVGYRNIPDPEGEEDSLRRTFLFHRINGVWTYVRPLFDDIDSNERDGVASHGVDLRNGIAALFFNGLTVFERAGDDYVQRPVEAAGVDRGDDVYVDPSGANRIILGDRCWGATIVARDPDGAWRRKAFLNGDFCGSTDGASGGPVALWGPSAVVANPYNADGLPEPALSTFTGFDGVNWEPHPRIVVPEGHSVGEVAMSDGFMLVQDGALFGTSVYRQRDDRTWQSNSTVEFLRGSNDWMGWRQCIGCYPHGGSVEIGEDFLLRHAYDSDSDRNVVHVYTRYQGNWWKHVANLVASDGGLLTGRIAISGRRVLLAGAGRAYYYELPTTFTVPNALQDTFAGATATGWTPQAGSAFIVTQGSSSRVYRQSSIAGEAGAVLDASSWTDQAIQVDVKPTALVGSDRWVGLVTRRASASNYYYVTFRSSGTIALKRMYQGQYTTLTSALLPFTLNRNYRLRLESVGNLHRVYVDGVKRLEARDHFLKQGRAGLLMYRVAADFDNVVVTPGLQTTMWRENGQFGGSLPNPEPWNYYGGQWQWVYEGSNAIFRQGSITDWSRALAGQATFEPDMVVEARARVTAFGAGTDPWFGILARGGESGNVYTYLALRRSNTVTLRHVLNGVVTQLGAAVLNVTPGAWYRLRLEIIGNRVRGYVNGRLVLEALVGSTTLSGQAGLVTYHTQADFDDFGAVVP